MQDRLVLSAIVFAFFTLWAPLGQHDFLYQHWMKVGAFMAPFLVMTAAAFYSASDDKLDPRTIALSLWVAYIIHQFEEHWIDLLGRHYAFKSSLNEILAGLIGDPSKTEILSDASVFVINTSLVWLVAALAIWRGSTYIFPTLCMTAIVVVNAISHLGAGLASLSYNPGLATAIVIFLPLGSFVYVWLVRSGLASLKLCGFSLLWGLVAHAIMVLGLLFMAQFDRPNEPVFFAALITWSILPCFLFKNASVR